MSSLRRVKTFASNVHDLMLAMAFSWPSSSYECLEKTSPPTDAIPNTYLSRQIPVSESLAGQETGTKSDKCSEMNELQCNYFHITRTYHEDVTKAWNGW